VNERYLRELSAELGAVGIRGARRRRILAETADHLLESADTERFGEPAVIAARFADELATGGAVRSGFRSFAALALAGAAYAVLFALISTWPDITSARVLPLALVAAVAMVLAPHVAFAAGLLALARAWRLRSTTAAPAVEISILRRRAAVALAAGSASMVAIGVYAYAYSGGLPGWWRDLAFALSGACLVPLAAAAVGLARTIGLRPQSVGPTGDVFDDLAPLLDRVPLQLRGHPWRLCLLVAAAVAVAALLAGGVDEGPRNAVAEFLAVWSGFAVFGRFLGLRT
jgi:hypothetical protein